MCNSDHLRHAASEAAWRCPSCASAFSGDTTYVDLLGEHKTQTGDHYSLQWGPDLDFADFLRTTPEAKAVMPASQLGWARLLAEISERSAAERITVFDAACGFGGIAEDLARGPTPAFYVGADLHEALPGIRERVDRFVDWGLLLRWDIARALPLDVRFDYVVCRAAIHHTPEPVRTFDALLASLKPGGKIAISAYARKPPIRELVDEGLRSEISKLAPDDAFAVCEGFAALGRSLRATSERIRIDEEIPILGIAPGEYTVHELVYDHLLKCFYNEQFGERFSTLVNYDWYHPEFAYRFDVDELVGWFERAGLTVLDVVSTRAQHYVEGAKAAA